MNEYLEFAKELAQEAGRIMKKYFIAEEIGLEIKSDQTPVTAADKEINELVINKVKQRFPDHGIMGEEDSYGLGRDNLWIVDPLDGTHNFARRIPLFAFSMALVMHGKLKIGVVYDPITDKLLWAEAGQGAYENERKLDLTIRPIPETLVISSWVVGGIENSIFHDKGVHGKVADLYARHGNIEETDFPIAYALAIVGSGSLDGVISTIRTPWDVAAGSLIAQEAGAKVTDLFGNSVVRWDKDANGILVSTPKVHAILLKTIQPALEKTK